MMRVKRRNATLVELLVAMGLLSILMSVLLGFYWQVRKMEVEAEQVRLDNFEERFVQYRLMQVIPQIYQEKGFYFFTSEDRTEGIKGINLVFTYDNSIDMVPELVSSVLGRLFVDEDHRLCLATWPLSIANRFQMKKEVLLSNVEALEFGFFVPEMNGKTVDTEPVQEGRKKIVPPKGWSPTWKREYDQVPALMRINIKRENNKEELLLCFPLPQSLYHIIFRG